LIDAVFCIPGDLALPTGGYRYDRELLARLPEQGVRARRLALPSGYPHPTAAEIDASRALLATESSADVLLIDGLALGAMPPSLVRSLPLPFVALVHHPLCLEAGLPPDREAELRMNESAVLREAAHMLTTSASTKRWLISEFGLAGEAITIAEPGVRRVSRAIGTGSPVALLAVGAVSERKAYDLLVAALARLPDRGWRLTIAGSLDLSHEAVACLREAIAQADLAERVVLAGAVDDETLAGFYASADIFVSASLHEGYGMALAEAMTHGLAIVASSGGAVDDLLPMNAALKASPGDVSALSAALGRAITETPLRRSLSDAAWEAGQGLPRWDDAARIVAGVLTAATGRKA